MIIGIIVACEILFWVLLAAGLSARYLLRMKRTSAVLLASVPAVDLILLTASVIDLRRGTPPTFAHSLAAIYLGVSLAYGTTMVRWADAWFSYFFVKGPRPTKPTGRAGARHELEMLARHAVAWAIGSSLLGLAHLLVRTDASAKEFLAKIVAWGVILLIDTAWSFWEAADMARKEQDESPADESRAPQAPAQQRERVTT